MSWSRLGSCAVVLAAIALGTFATNVPAQAQPVGMAASGPHPSQVVHACRDLSLAQDEGSIAAARGVQQAVAAATVAAQRSPRWDTFATDLREVAALPGTGDTPAQVVRAQELVGVLADVCQSVGVSLAESPTVAPGVSPEVFANDKVAYDYFVGKGLASYQAAGIVGNFDQESGDSPTSCQVAGCGSGGEGIAQWSVGGRWNSDPNDNVVSYAAGLAGSPSPTTLTPQLDFTWYELTTFSYYGLSSLESSTNVTDATTDFEGAFEGCNPTYCDTANRITYAKDVLAAYGTSIPTSGEVANGLRFTGYQSMPGGLVLNAKAFGDPADAVIFARNDGSNEVASRYQLADGYVAYAMRYRGATYCLNLKGGGTASGTDVIFHKCSLSAVAANEQFRQAANTPSGYRSGYHLIVPATAQTMCLNAKGGQVADAQVILYPCNSQANEAWADATS